MKNLNHFFKVLFHIINVILIFIYLYPGSILGYIVYKDFSKQPNITEDFLNISSNHFYAFLILGILGILAYPSNKKINFIFIYLFILSIILELMHIMIPERSFQYSDLFGNSLGVIFIFTVLKFWKLK